MTTADIQPMMDIKMNNKPNTPGTPVSKEQRAKVIADIAARKKTQDEAAARRDAGLAPLGSRDARRDEATRSGVVTPSKATRPVKIPAAANLVKPRVDDTSTATEGDVRDRKAFAAVKDGDVRDPIRVAQAGADAELDAAVRPSKKVKDPSMLSVGDVARELGVDPKRARARLRASGAAAVEGRWPKVKRDSDEHKALVATLTTETKTPATT